jgi:hypothetical protein
MARRCNLDGGTCFVDGLPSELFTDRTLHRIWTTPLRRFVCRRRRLQRICRVTGRTFSTQRTDPLHRRADRTAHRGHRGALRGLGAVERRYLRRCVARIRATRRPSAPVDRMPPNLVDVCARRYLAFTRLCGFGAQRSYRAPFDPPRQRAGRIGRSRSNGFGYRRSLLR